MDGRNGDVLIRMAVGLEEFQQCVDIQGAVWGYDDSDIVPRRMFLLAMKIGGQVLGAFAPDGKMIGFAMALPAYRDGKPYLHSHMLAVLPEYRNAGLGRRLKLAQRDDAISRGIERMEWTYDPLETKNAYLNIAKLGAISRRYEANFYGPSTSALQGGLPTDRLYAEWWLRSERVERALSGEAATFEPLERVVVPKEVAEWKAAADLRAHAAAVQTANRLALQDAFSRGMAILGYERDEQKNGVFLLGELEKSTTLDVDVR
ncbi:putative GNAT superfamily acetyltransferase [Granulicella aggregans]|uniref:Putative GNAT superfamily acetyltransferase n=1 Tax=Granulicella aggregans TaxID=474949 RepID=A0A7W8E1L3_9BACT|nr:GNAT family N-acetyltransferase [Granulicella aggregans]MBB5055547.1 putative GNAT superfamily acetyltransferase [Granulicella aggregans]